MERKPGDFGQKFTLCDSETHESVAEIFKSFSNGLIDYASFTRVENKENKRYYFSNREWGIHSINQRYIQKDPIAQAVFDCGLKSFHWSYINYNSETRMIQEERQKYLELVAGFSLSAHEDKSFLSLGTCNPALNLRGFVIDNLTKVLAFSAFCHKVLGS